MSFPIDTIVNVTIDRLTQFPTQKGFGIPAILDINTWQAEDVATYTDPAEMLDAGATTADEAYKAAVSLMSQNPKPEKFKVLKRAANQAQVDTVTVGGNADGLYSDTINGTAFSYTASSNTAEEIRDALVAAINGGSEPVTAAPVSTDQYTLTADTPGVGFSSELASPGDVLTEVNTTLNVGPDSELFRLINIDDSWYFLISTDQSNQSILQLAAAVETIIKLYAVATDEADSRDLPQATDTTSLLAILQANAYDRTFSVWSDENESYPDAAWVGKNAPKDPGSITWKFKSVAGIIPSDELTTTQKLNITAKNGNTYTTVGGISIFEEGVVASGEFIDIMRGTDWIQARIQENVYFLLSSEDKVPYDNGGIEAVALRVEQIMQLAVERQVLRGGEQAPIVTVPDVVETQQSDRANRLLRDVKFEGFYSGAIHRVRIEGTLSV